MAKRHRPEGGRAPKFESPLSLWTSFEKYCDHMDKYERKGNRTVTTNSKTGTSETYNYKIKPYSMTGFYSFIGVWHLEHYKAKSEFDEVFKVIKDTIDQNKKDLAYMNIINSNVAIRDLGMADKIEQEIDNINENPLEVKFIRSKPKEKDE